MGNLGAPELILILLVIVVFFGAKKIPEIAQGFGKGIREFRKASKEIQESMIRKKRQQMRNLDDRILLMQKADGTQKLVMMLKRNGTLYQLDTNRGEWVTLLDEATLKEVLDEEQLASEPENARYSMRKSRYRHSSKIFLDSTAALTSGLDMGFRSRTSTAEPEAISSATENDCRAGNHLKTALRE